MSCRQCGESIIEFDSTQGNSVCTNCGTVIEENTIVSEVTFGESASGAAVLQGSYVAADKGRAAIGSYRRQNALESREKTIAEGRQRIQSIATALRLSERFMEAAQRYFNLAIANNFLQGRKTQNVVAACLYVVCRMEKTSHMLIDFSDILQTNVFTLGSTFLKLVRELHLNLPLVDPSLYISRFAAMLEFGDKTHAVAADAMRLVQRMDRDWIQTGRRPAGICGACLLIAARMHNFRRTQREIIQVVKIAEITLRKRLDEFKETPSGNLSVSDFQNLWLEEACDPPAFKRARKKHKDVTDEDEETEKEKEQKLKIESQSTQTKEEKASQDSSETEENEEENLAAEMNEYLHGEQLLGLAKDMNVKDIDEEVENWSDIDDDEIRNVILDDEEVKVKTEVWTENNKEYLEQLEAKRKREELNQQLGINTKTHRKRRKKSTKPTTPAQTVVEAAKQMLNTKKVSKKINYAVLESLFEDNGSADNKEMVIKAEKLSQPHVVEEFSKEESKEDVIREIVEEETLPLPNALQKAQDIQDDYEEDYDDNPLVSHISGDEYWSDGDGEVDEW
ncbi:BRF1-domain-containing protein [Basidiobolus meristosporus CBS 931.73]|uniref:B-related factor 1 n=1 Tax=Basidiobolus meristosporus CBS 931.73 TaxID=1314790 RepID=A0A1Y1YBR4_9FUNG|nr:BRF1-domain-containing protein [Basidiobolus meristosporus CBS 931.73]|eukprot:ORX95439.1 BRF1-domain-containing protein [Basidiobolus meristosporus CBS 931.73]